MEIINKTQESDQIETIKTIMQTTRLVSHGRFTPMAQVAIFKNIRSSAKDLDCDCFILN